MGQPWIPAVWALTRSDLRAALRGKAIWGYAAGALAFSLAGAVLAVLDFEDRRGLWESSVGTGTLVAVLWGIGGAQGPSESDVPGLDASAVGAVGRWAAGALSRLLAAEGVLCLCLLLALVLARHSGAVPWAAVVSCLAAVAWSHGLAPWLGALPAATVALAAWGLAQTALAAQCAGAFPPSAGRPLTALALACAALVACGMTAVARAGLARGPR